MPNAQFDHRVLIPVTPANVWAALQEARTWADLGPVDKVWDATHEEGVLSSYRWSAQAGPRRVAGTARTRQAVKPHLMVMELDAGEFNGLLTTELEPEAGATALSVVLSMEANGFLSVMFFGVIKDTIGKGLPVQVEAFAEKLAARSG